MSSSLVFFWWRWRSFLRLKEKSHQFSSLCFWLELITGITLFCLCVQDTNKTYSLVSSLDDDLRLIRSKKMFQGYSHEGELLFDIFLLLPVISCSLLLSRGSLKNLICILRYSNRWQTTWFLKPSPFVPKKFLVRHLKTTDVLLVLFDRISD